MARLNLDCGQLRPQRPQPNHPPMPPGAGLFDPPLDPLHALPVHSIRRTDGRSRNRHVGLKHRGQLRQRTGRNRHRIVQGGDRQTSWLAENYRSARMGDHEMGALAQQRPAAWRGRLPNPGRKGEWVPPTKKRARNSSPSFEHNSLWKPRGNSELAE